MAEVHLVHVHLEDAVLRVAALQLQRQHRLLQLPLQTLVRREKEDLRELLRDGAAPLDEASAPVVLDHRARHADRIDAPVGVEALVFRRDHRVPERLRDLGQRHEDAPLHVELGERLVVVVVDLGAEDGLQRLERGDRGKRAGEDRECPQRGDRRRGEDQERDGPDPDEKASQPAAGPDGTIGRRCRRLLRTDHPGHYTGQVAEPCSALRPRNPL